MIPFGGRETLLEEPVLLEPRFSDDLEDTHDGREILILLA